MDPHLVKYIMIGGVMFVVFGVVPIVMALLSHQQKMAELFAKNNSSTSELLARIESMERRLASQQLPAADNRPGTIPQPVGTDRADVRMG